MAAFAGFESSHAPLSTASLASTSSPAHWACTLPPPALPMCNIQASWNPVRFSSLTLIIGTQSKRHDHSTDSASDDQHDKRAHIGIKVEPINDGSHGSNISAGSAPLVTMCDTTPFKGDGEWDPLFNIRDAMSDRHDPTSEHSNFSSGHGHPSVQPRSSDRVQPKNWSNKTASAASHNPNQPAFELNNPTYGPAKGDSSDVVDVEYPGSMGDQDRDSVVGVSEEDVIQDNDKSDSESNSQESITNSGPESAMGDDCLTCSDTKEAAVRLACKRFCKKMWAICSPPKQGICRDTQLEQIRNIHNTVGEWLWGCQNRVRSHFG